MKIKIGLRGLRVAQLKDDISATLAEDGKAVVNYEAVQVLPNVQNVNLTARKQSVEVDSDDQTDTLMQTSGYDGTIQRTMFTPEEQAMLLGEKTLENGTVVSSSDDEAPEFAVGFMCRLNTGGFYTCWILRAKFSSGDITAESAGDNKLNPQSDVISVKSSYRAADHAWRFYKIVETETEAAAFLTVDTIKQLATAAASADSGDGDETTDGDGTGDGE
ncbi:MAG: hypothetical protein IJJ55_06005 [Clostridia bacterium]|nr:hypothetical protein [Clostridia bacterium]MBR0470749.1 hypothetical protein [Clostridia bacterium]